MKCEWAVRVGDNHVATEPTLKRAVLRAKAINPKFKRGTIKIASQPNGWAQSVYVDEPSGIKITQERIGGWN